MNDNFIQIIDDTEIQLIKQGKFKEAFDAMIERVGTAKQYHNKKGYYPKKPNLDMPPRGNTSIQKVRYKMSEEILLENIGLVVSGNPTKMTYKEYGEIMGEREIPFLVRGYHAQYPVNQFIVSTLEQANKSYKQLQAYKNRFGEL